MYVCAKAHLASHWAVRKFTIAQDYRDFLRMRTQARQAAARSCSSLLRFFTVLPHHELMIYRVDESYSSTASKNSFSWF
jgi:hypothetical protein